MTTRREKIDEVIKSHMYVKGIFDYPGLLDKLEKIEGEIPAGEKTSEKTPVSTRHRPQPRKYTYKPVRNYIIIKNSQKSKISYLIWKRLAIPPRTLDELEARGLHIASLGFTLNELDQTVTFHAGSRPWVYETGKENNFLRVSVGIGSALMPSGRYYQVGVLTFKYTVEGELPLKPLQKDKDKQETSDCQTSDCLCHTCKNCLDRQDEPPDKYRRIPVKKLEGG